jgi:UDP-N-acetylmuramyl pentapeptide synthase
VQSLGTDLARGMLALADFRAPKGRGERLTLFHPAGAFTLLDESYNASPASMRAALALLGAASPDDRGRRIAVLGDMRELGPAAADLHRELAGPVGESQADAVFLVGPLMQNLWQALPEARRGAYAEDASAMQPILLDAIGPGDVVMVKASLGTRLGALVEALKQRFAAESP